MKLALTIPVMFALACAQPRYEVEQRDDKYFLVDHEQETRREIHEGCTGTVEDYVRIIEQTPGSIELFSEDYRDQLTPRSNVQSRTGSVLDRVTTYVQNDLQSLQQRIEPVRAITAEELRSAALRIHQVLEEVR